MSPQALELLVARILATELSASATALALALCLEADRQDVPFIAFYDDLAVRVGPRRRGAAHGSRQVVADAAAELVSSGLIARRRKSNSLGRTDGPETPYVWWFLSTAERRAGAPARWQSWLQAVLRVAEYGYRLGPVATAAYARTAVAADARGRLCLTLPELATVARMEHRTAEKHLREIAKVGALKLIELPSRRRTLELGFTVTPPLPAKDEQVVSARITAAHNRTKRNRGGQEYPLQAEARPPAAGAAEVEAAMNELIAVSGREAVAHLREIIALMEVRGRRFTPTQIVTGFVAPVKAHQLRRRNDRTFSERVLRLVKKRAAKTNEPPIGNFARYFDAVCKQQPRFPTDLKNPRRLTARHEGRPFYLSAVCSSGREDGKSL